MQPQLLPTEADVGGPFAASRFTQPRRVCYSCARQSDVFDVGDPRLIHRNWDCVEVRPSVAVLVHHLDRRAFLLVKQWRPPVWLHRCRQLQQQARASRDGDEGAPHAPLEAGLTLELCGGYLDNPSLDERQTAAAEVAEELGYSVDPAALVRLFALTEATAVTGAALTCFLATVREGDRVGSGGGLEEEGERIQAVELNDDPGSVSAFIADETVARSADLLLAVALVTRGPPLATAVHQPPPQPRKRQAVWCTTDVLWSSFLVGGALVIATMTSLLRRRRG
jgi:UDP-sugar diphosphatase